MTRRDGATGRPPTPIISQLATELTAIREQYGVQAMLVMLNARTRYRFTGIYRVEPPLLRNLYLVDRENPSIDVSGGVDSLDGTYSAIAASTGAPLAVEGVRTPSHLDGHRVRPSTLRSYLGVPIRGADGRVCGTLCHFDLRPRLLPDSEIPVLEWLAATLADCVG